MKTGSLVGCMSRTHFPSSVVSSQGEACYMEMFTNGFDLSAWTSWAVFTVSIHGAWSPASTPECVVLLLWNTSQLQHAVAAGHKIPEKRNIGWAEWPSAEPSPFCLFPDLVLVISGSTAFIYREDKRVSHLPKVTWVVSGKKRCKLLPSSLASLIFSAGSPSHLHFSF